jgi:protein-disulfide isomerase
MPAANAAECAGEQGKFWEMHDRIFENNRALEDANLETYAKTVGVDAGRWKKCYAENKHRAKIQSDQRTAVVLGARGTPAFFVNGRFLSGAQPLPAFEALVDEELKKAKASGISKSEYYAKAVVEKGLKKL